MIHLGCTYWLEELVTVERRRSGCWDEHRCGGRDVLLIEISRLLVVCPAEAVTSSVRIHLE